MVPRPFFLSAQQVHRPAYSPPAGQALAMQRHTPKTALNIADLRLTFPSRERKAYV